MSETENNTQGQKPKISKIAIWVTAFCLVVFLTWWLLKSTHRETLTLNYRIPCSTNLKGLGIAMLIYANDFDDKYPTAEKWCDLLVEYYEVTEKEFRCPGNKKGKCSYAINPNCEPNSPNDVVLLFETTGGWNQFGGPEILTTENHKGKGCNVLFNDYHVEFVKPERLGELKWKVEESEK